MSAFCLDLGNSTGWAIVENGEVKHSGCIVNGKPKDSAGRRYWAFDFWINLILGDPDLAIDEIYYEDVRAHKGTAAAHAFGGYAAILAMAAHTASRASWASEWSWPR